MEYGLPFITWFWLFVPCAVIIGLSLISLLNSGRSDQ